MIEQQDVIGLIEELASESSDIEVVWLYGSRAKGNANESSDYDLAVAYSDVNEKSSSNDYYTDDLAFKWSNKTSVAVSIIDINHIPVPLAISVISDGKVIFCRNDLRLHSEESRVWSMWEAYRYEYARK
ncbi:MAG: nucleotidyltransferase domain-containing protein [Thiotrichaceae bacterium]|nr:nucleotidyltransferase domain-containing protein [Thiotrichaceae bacterium]